MPIALRQSAGNVTGTDNSSCRVNLSSTTQQGSLIVVIAGARAPGTADPFTSDPSGFTRVVARRSDRTGDDVAVAVWYRQNANPLSSVTVSARHLSLTVRVLEITGAAQANALDKVTSAGGDSIYFTSGSTGTIAQADSLLIGAVVNQYASTRQSGFTGGLAWLSETTPPSSDLDHERHRLTVHAAVTTAAQSFSLGGRLSASRDWAAVLIAFKGASLGPARMTSVTAPPLLRFGGRGDLTVFGPLTSRTAQPTIRFGGRGWIGPSNYQYLLGGRTGLLIGDNTDYRVESHDGLEGWQIRTSDENLSRLDGARRGIDLQAARQIVFELKVGGTQLEVEAAMEALYRALVPRRDSDWDLIWRHPGRPLRVLRCRPTDLSRELSWRETLINHQAFTLLAADPRIYSLRTREVTVPVTATAGDVVEAVSVPNDGNAPAYPVIRFSGDPSVEVTHLELVNVTGNVAFEFDGILPPRGQLIADMPARVGSEPRSVITLDGQSKYGSWTPPREPFFLAPDPDAPGGVNAVYLRTTPPGAAVTCILEYRDTWSG